MNQPPPPPPSMQPLDMFGPPPGPPPRPKTPVVLIVLGICMVACCLIVPAVLFPVFLQARQAAQRRVAMSYVRQLAIAGQMFENDYRGLPDMKDMETFRLMVNQYVRSERVFTDRATGKPFELNSRLSHALFDSIRNPTETPLVYQAAPDKNGMRIVGFVDSRVARITDAQFRTDLGLVKGIQYTLGPLTGRWSFKTTKGDQTTLEFVPRSTVRGQDKVRWGDTEGAVSFDVKDHLDFANEAPLDGDVKWTSLDAFTLTTKDGTLNFKRVSGPPR